MSCANRRNFEPVALRHLALSVYVAGATATNFAAADAPDSAALVERGKYLALAGNCGSCHTEEDGEFMAGGVAFVTPFGTLYSTNITSHPEAGIGSWTKEQFRQSLRSGVRPNGEHLYPAFPYTAFTKITDADIDALYAYFRTVPAAASNPPENELSFPFDQRWLMAGWKALFFEEGAYRADPGRSAEWNRGAYLVEGLGHCGACHTPRNLLGAERSSAHMSGGTYMDRIPDGTFRPWSTVNLTSASTGLANWSVEELAAYLKTGMNSFIGTHGPMNEVIMNSTRHLSDEDVLAMSVYLKSLPPIESNTGAKASAEELRLGETVYTLNCGTCHLPTGMGAEDSGPPIALSPLLRASDPTSLLNVIIYGPQLPDPPLPTKWRMMEAFGETLSDEEIAALATYLRSTWGSQGGTVTVKQVQRQF